MSQFPIGSPAQPPANAPLAGVAALTADESYLAVLEADWYVARLLPPSSYAARMWFASTNEAKAAMLRAATRKIDALRFVGVKASETQMLDWPRLNTCSRTRLDPSSDSIEHLVADLPRAVRYACAIQAAHEAANAGAGAGLNIAEENAGKGIVSTSGNGRSQSVDLSRATNAFARLCRDAQDLLDMYRFTQGDAL
jgi:hypothetical protein